MAYLPPDIRARIEAQITSKTEQLAAVNTAYLNSLTNAEIQTYTLDTGEGKQSTTRRKPEELQRAIRILETDLERLYRRLNGGGLVNMNLRR